MRPDELIVCIEAACRPWADRFPSRREAALLVRQFAAAFGVLTDDKQLLLNAKAELEETGLRTEEQCWCWFVVSRVLMERSTTDERVRMAVDDALYLCQRERKQYTAPYALSLSTVYNIDALHGAVLRMSNSPHFTGSLRDRVLSLISHSMLTSEQL
jgi:hypothetical protein